MPYSITYANNILSWTFGKGSLSTISKVYVGLCSNDPEADNGTFTELSGGGYTRVLVSIYSTAYPDVIGTASSREIKNTKQIAWPKATADWEAAKGFGLFQAETGGAPYFYGKLAATVTCASGEVALFDPSALVIKLSSTDELLSSVNALSAD